MHRQNNYQTLAHVLVLQCNTDSTWDWSTYIPLISVKAFKKSFFPNLVSPMSSKSSTSSWIIAEAVTPLSVKGYYYVSQCMTDSVAYIIFTRECLAVFVTDSFWFKPLEEILVRHGTVKRHTLCLYLSLYIHSCMSMYIIWIDIIPYFTVKILIAWLMWKLNMRKHMCTNNGNAVQGCLSENYLTRKFITQNILDMKYSQYTAVLILYSDWSKTIIIPQH